MRLYVSTALAVAICAIAAMTIASRPSPAGAANATPTSWTFALDDVEDVPRAGVQESMFAFLVEIDGQGTPELARAWRLRGVAPRSHGLQRGDVDVWRWVLRDSHGQLLADGQIADRVLRHSPLPEEGCTETLVGAHPLMIRTRWWREAATLELARIVEMSR